MDTILSILKLTSNIKIVGHSGKLRKLCQNQDIQFKHTFSYDALYDLLFGRKRPDGNRKFKFKKMK